MAPKVYFSFDIIPCSGSNFTLRDHRTAGFYHCIVRAAISRDGPIAASMTSVPNEDLLGPKEGLL